MNRIDACADATSLAARICLALLFVPSGFAKLGGFAAVVGSIAAKGVPVPEVCAAIAVGAELGLGLLLLMGLTTRRAALGLAIFVAVITPLFHNFWAVPPAQVTLQQLMFFKNLAILGGLLLVAI